MTQTDLVTDLRHQLKEKDQFLAVLSHEIRSPMNGVFGMAEALLRTDLNDVQKRYLTVLMDACESMLSIANQVLDISKTKSGQAKLVLVDFDLKDFMTLQVASFSRRADVDDIDLELELDFEADSYIHFDKFRLGQVVTNLISNALRYTDKGRVVVRASLKPLRNDLLFLTLSVQDTGIGMSPEAIDGIFEAFSSANPIESAARGGTGLGLTIVRDLIDLMHGDITVDSVLGQGTNFAMSLSVTSGKSRPETQIHRNKTIRKNLKILLVEDNDTNAFVFGVLLSDTSVQITHVKTGQEAAALTSECHFDIVFMDIQMPGIDGIKTTAKIRAAEKTMHKAALPIVSLSADVFIDQDPKYIAVGFDGNLSKPIRSTELLDLLASV